MNVEGISAPRTVTMSGNAPSQSTTTAVKSFETLDRSVRWSQDLTRTASLVFSDDVRWNIHWRCVDESGPSSFAVLFVYLRDQTSRDEDRLR